MKRMVDEKEVVRDIEAVEGGIKVLQLDGTSKTIPVSGGGDAVWGSITGTLSEQTDLQNALNAKQNTLVAGQDIDITSNVISTVYGGGYTSDTTSATGSFECYASESGLKRFSIVDQTFAFWYNNNVRYVDVNETRYVYDVICTITDPNNVEHTFNIPQMYHYNANQLRNTNAGWDVAASPYTIFKDSTVASDTVQLTLIGNDFADWGTIEVGTYCSITLSITRNEIAEPIADKFISPEIVRYSQLSDYQPVLATDKDVKIDPSDSNLISTIYGGEPAINSSYDSGLLTGITTSYATANFVRSTNANFVQALYDFDKSFTLSFPSSVLPIFFNLDYSLSIVDQNTNTRVTLETVSNAAGYTDADQDYIDYVSGRILRTFYYRTAGADARIGFFDPTTGNNISVSGLISYLNTRDNANYDMNTIQLDTFQLTSTVATPATPILADYIPIDGVSIINNNGVLEAQGSAPANMMTTDTSQEVIIDHRYGESSSTGLKKIKFTGNYMSGTTNYGIVISDQQDNGTEQDRFYLYGRTPINPGQEPLYELTAVHNSDSFGINNTIFGRARSNSNVASCYPNGRSAVLGQKSTANGVQTWRGLYLRPDTTFTNIEVIFDGLPTTDPQVAGQLWNDNGVLKISSGN